MRHGPDPAQDASGGHVAAQWDGAGACSGNVTWPALDTFVVMGLNQTVNTSSLVLQAGSQHSAACSADELFMSALLHPTRTCIL